LLAWGRFVIAAIVGSRTGLHWPKVANEIRAIVAREDIGTVVSGGALGVDRLAESLAIAAGKRFQAFPADWARYGKSAGMRRNHDIVSASDEVFAFWDGKSRGTKATIEMARRAGKPVHVRELLP
jgi:hypothetical protein